MSEASRQVPPPYDAVLIVSFGGPEGPDEVMPFLENVLRGRNVPRERMLEVAEHYQAFGGVSPINAQNRDLVAALDDLLRREGLDLPVYWGNRNWRPFLADTLRGMAQAGRRRALAFVTSAYSSYSGCRQYREDIARAREELGPEAPMVDKLRVFFNHPGFVEVNAERLREALERIPPDRRAEARVAFTAHSLPLAMARGCAYEAQLRETCRLVAGALGIVEGRWDLVYQSRSGPPGQPWLEPDIGDHIETLAGQGVGDLVVAPIGFVSDHMEVVYDLDTEARERAETLGIRLVRAGTAGTHPRFVAMIRELIEERISANPRRRSLGSLGPSHDLCPDDCCLYPMRPTQAAETETETTVRTG